MESLACLLCGLLILAISTDVKAQDTVRVSHGNFSFDKYPDTGVFEAETKQEQPYSLSHNTDIHYSHLFHTLSSPVTGNLTAVRYLARPEFQSFEFQIWTQLSNGSLHLKEFFTVTPSYPSTENVFTPPSGTRISGGDICGVWVDQNYPIPTARLNNTEGRMDILVRNGLWSSRIKPQAPEAIVTPQDILPTHSFDFMPAMELTITLKGDGNENITTVAPPRPVFHYATSTGMLDLDNYVFDVTASPFDAFEDELTFDKETVTPNGKEPVVSSNDVSESEDFNWKDDVLLVVILAPTSVVVFLLIILTAVYCVIKRQRRYQKRVAELKSTYAPSYVYATSSHPDHEPDYDTYGNKIPQHHMTHHMSHHMTNAAYNPEMMYSTSGSRTSERVYQTPMMISPGVPVSLPVPPGVPVSLPLPPPDYGNLGYEHYPEEMSEHHHTPMVYHYQDANCYAEPHITPKPDPYLYVQVEEGIHYY